MNKKIIAFDMDGTIADLYADPFWLPKLRSYDPTPYANAKPLVDMTLLSKYLQLCQEQGWEIYVISWLSKESTPAYDKAVIEAKMAWLQEHLPTVHFNAVHLVSYGTPKSLLIPPSAKAILFDDEYKNLTEFINSGKGSGIYPQYIFEILEGIICGAIFGG